MPKRPRPYIPLSVRLQVVERQCAETLYITLCTAGSVSERLGRGLSILFGNPFFHLDHDPPLRVRAFNPRTGKYKPDANDPDFLIYRTAEAHRFKTNVRGDGAQYPDRVLIKRERRRGKKKRKYNWPSRPIQSRGF